MEVVREVETKLAVGSEFEVPRLAEIKGVDRIAVHRLRLKAVHHDTEDLRLARAGTTLRHRTGEGRPRWTLKLASRSATGLDREELTVLGPGTRVPPVLLDLLTAPLRGAPLHVVVQIRTARTASVLFDLEGHELVEVVDDHVEVWRDGTAVYGWREVEVEQRAEAGKVAKRVLRALRDAGGSDADQTPKAIRALGPGAQAAPDLPVPRRVRPRDPAGDVVQRSLALGLEGLVRHDLAVRRDQPDAVHQLRVTCRRLRSDLRVFRELLDDPRAELLRAELSWLAGSLGAARDLEVLRARLRVTAALDPLAPLDASGVDALLAQQEDAAAAQALDALRSPRYLVLLQLLHDLASGPTYSPEGARRTADVLPPLVDRARTHLQRRRKGLKPADPDERWHRVRILAKRARYTAETSEHVLGKSAHARAAKRVQTALGLHQDAAVAAARFLELAADHPELAVVCARLAERERAQVIEARRAFLRR